MDCMEGMKQFPDKYFELAIVDLYAIKPFGIPYNVRKMGCQMQNQNKGDRLCFKI